MQCATSLDLRCAAAVVVVVVERNLARCVVVAVEQTCDVARLW